MKIIHTADWHLGQTFFEYDRKGEHTLFLTWLREQVKVHGGWVVYCRRFV